MHIKNHQNFKILFWSRESEETIFTIFPDFFTRKIRNTGISSETTIPGISSETTETREFPGAGREEASRRPSLDKTHRHLSKSPGLL